MGDAAGGYAGGKLGGKGTKNIGIKKDPKRGNRCRRKRAGGSGGCSIRFFNDLENFDPVPGLRVIADSRNGPARRVQRNPNANNRVEYVDAQIQRNHLKITDEGLLGDSFFSLFCLYDKTKIFFYLLIFFRSKRRWKCNE